ncbi:MAG: hypothetical protein HC895_00430 [Leptolyngbyaceae cyanobacterium SM1_3_5]|nr:hypothetical protein [Leptolyngbyaceae cyanobacterium SM1_3_5]
MNPKIAVGTAFVCSTPIINATASTVGVAGTGTAIGTLTGAAHTSATAAWIGFGSMKLGMCMMGALPVVGALLILDRIAGRGEGVSIIDWREEFWKQYRAQCELEEMKKAIQVDSKHQVEAEKTARSSAQLEGEFRSLEDEHELNLMKKELGLI